MKWWNYYNDTNIRTNNPCEGFNNRLNSYFSKKPTFYNLINVLAREELLMKKDYEMSIMNGFKKFYKIANGRGEYLDFLPYYIEKEELIQGSGLKAKREKINLFKRMQHLTHDMENVFQEVTNDNIKVNSTLIDI